MTQSELDIQKQLVSVFERLKNEIPRLSSEVSQLGYRQRNALISHVYSNYNEHEKLNEARTKWEKMIVVMNVHQWFYDLMVENRDLFGYFENHETMFTEIDSIISAGVRKEEYEIVDILVKWRQEMPNPIKAITQ